MLNYTNTPTPTASLQRVRVASVAPPTSGTDLSIRVLANPSQSGCALSYHGRADQPLEVKLFDIRGRCLQSFTVRPADTGEGKLLWDGRTNTGAAAPPGVYFFRARQGQALETVRVVLLR
jgi:hypothetical protein